VIDFAARRRIGTARVIAASTVYFISNTRAWLIISSTIVARQHGGSDALENPALSSSRCNLSKGPDLTAIDTDSGEIAPLFSPRRDSRTDHFQLYGPSNPGIDRLARATRNCSASMNLAVSNCRPRSLSAATCREGKSLHTRSKGQRRPSFHLLS
jgi:hypothetical protein